jgi:hypothetical protein
MTAFFDTPSYSIAEVDRRFRGVVYVVSYSDDGGSVSMSETSVNFYKTARRNIPEWCQF